MTPLWAARERPAPQHTLVLYLVKAMRRRLFLRLTRASTRTFLTRDISKPRVVQADLKLLEMQMQGHMEMHWAQGQVTAREEPAGRAGGSSG